MMMSDCPDTYVSRSSKRRVTFRAALAQGEMLESYQRFAYQIEAPPDLAVPQTPTDPIDGFKQRGAGLAIIRRRAWPAFGRPINMLDPHRKVEPVEHMMRRARTGRFAESARTLRPIAENRDRGDGRRAQFMENAAQLVLLRNSLRGQAAENDLLPVVIRGLGEQNLERAHPDTHEPT